MNEESVRLADEVVGVVIAHFGLPANVPVRSVGMSMGGASALGKAGRRVTYVVSEGQGHCGLSPMARAAYDRALYAPMQ